MEIQQYDDFAARHNAAMAAARSIYEAMHPRPVMGQVSRDLVSRLTLTALVIVMVAAVIVSGSRTIDEFSTNSTFIGAIAFIMVEGGIMAYAFFRARRNASKERLQNTVRWATAGLIFIVIVALAANVDATLRAHKIVLPETVKAAINLLVAISAPALGFISSDILAIELMATDIKRRDNEEKHRLETEKWEVGFNQWWLSQRKNWGVKVEIPTPSNGIPLENIGKLPSKSTVGHTKAPDAMKRVEAYFQENPNASSENPLEIAASLGVGKSTVYNYLKAHKGDAS